MVAPNPQLQLKKCTHREARRDDLQSVYAAVDFAEELTQVGFPPAVTQGRKGVRVRRVEKGYAQAQTQPWLQRPVPGPQKYVKE